MYNHMKQKGLGQDEQEFVDLPLTNQGDDSDLTAVGKKPKYYNSVKTGFEWNKYNQTHYDAENPPPKVVQGYKFNVFYPDLIDKRSTPQFFLENVPNQPDVVIIRFKASVPYS